MQTNLMQCAAYGLSTDTFTKKCEGSTPFYEILCIYIYIYINIHTPLKVSGAKQHFRLQMSNLTRIQQQVSLIIHYTGDS